MEGWKCITNDPSVSSIVAKGYRLRFTSAPLLLQAPWEIRFPQGDIEDPGNARADFPNASEERNPRNISSHSRVLFERIHGTQGIWRVASSYRLKKLNHHIDAPHFRRHTISSVLSTVEKKETTRSKYFHVLIHPHSRKYLRFAFENKVYQFQVLHFSLNTAPQVFTEYPPRKPCRTEKCPNLWDHSIGPQVSSHWVIYT